MSKSISDNRMAWIVAALGVLGAVAVAFGFSTPGDRLNKDEAKISDHETRIQKLEDIHEYLDKIADAVGAQKPKARTP